MKTVKLLSLAVLAALAGCDGDDGTNGSNGIDGNNGVNGATSLISQTLLTVGNAMCLNGGVKIDSGVDDDGSGILDAAEVDATEYVCSPTLTQAQGSALSATTNNLWYEQGQSVLTQAGLNAQSLVNTKGKAKNVILFVGDGMGISTVTATRILAGQKLGKMGEEHQLSFDKFPYSGFAKTYNVDAQTPVSYTHLTLPTNREV